MGRRAAQKWVAMLPSAEELRKEARQLLRETEGFIDPNVKQVLAARAFELAQRAERIDVLAADPERLKGEIARCRSMLMESGFSPAQRRIVRDALADAESLMTDRKLPSPARAALVTSCLLSGASSDIRAVADKLRRERARLADSAFHSPYQGSQSNRPQIAIKAARVCSTVGRAVVNFAVG